MKWPGSPTPWSARPSRHATSSSMIARLIGRPTRRSRTRSRRDRSGSASHPGRRPEAELAVEHVVEGVEDAARAIAQVEVDPHPLGEVVQPLEAGLRVQLLAALARDQQRAEGEVDLRLGARDEPREPGAVGRAGGVEAGHPGIVAPPVRSASAWTTARPAAR